MMRVHGTFHAGVLNQVLGKWEIVYSSILGGEGYMPGIIEEIVTVERDGGMRIDTRSGPIPLGR